MEKKRASQQAWREGNRDKLHNYHKQQKRNHPASFLLTQARSRSKTRGQEFNIDITDVIIPEICPYLKVKLNTSYVDGHKAMDAPSIDRIDSTKGYIKGNVEVISRLANIMKNNATQDQLLEFAHSIIERHRDSFVD